MFKVCSSCGQEYQSWVTECSDCGVPLEPAPGETTAPAARAVAELGDLVALRTGGPWELQAIAESLQAHGISSRIDAHPPNTQLSVYVGRGDLDAAREIAAALAARDLPDADEGVAHDPTACPACGEPTPENAAACAACGLEFPEVPAEE